MDILYIFSATITNASIKLAKNQTCKTMKLKNICCGRLIGKNPRLYHYAKEMA
jgi:hypothetical protein